MSKQYCVYILTNRYHTVLYVGITSSIQRRMAWHLEQKNGSHFTTRYRTTKLVHVEVFDDPYYAIQREKQIKRWGRRKKVELIQSSNKDWIDLYPTLPPMMG